MRPKIIILILVAGGIMLTSAFLWHQKASGTKGESPPEPIATSSESAVPATSTRPVRHETDQSITKNQEANSAPETNQDGPSSLEEKHAAYVAARVAELQDLGSDDSPDSLNTILSELTNRDPEIRKAAVDAAVQFGSRDALPKLIDASLQVDDPQERAAFADAIEFLKLPHLTEIVTPGDATSAQAK